MFNFFNHKKIFISIIIGISFFNPDLNTAYAHELSANALWEQFKKNPRSHPLIPDNSYAGYYQGEKKIPVFDKDSAINVKKIGAKGDGTSDDTSAIQAALDLGGKIFFPKGKYLITSRLKIQKSNTHLSGEEKSETILFFKNPLSKIEEKYLDSTGRSFFSWSGGLIEVYPKALDETIMPHNKQIWDIGSFISSVKEEAHCGDVELKVDNTSGLMAGDWIFVNWIKPVNKKTLNLIAGFSKESGFNWNENGKAWVNRSLPWPVKIKSLDKGKIILSQPLRLEIKKYDKVNLYALNNYIHDVGIENLSIEMNSGKTKNHLQELGFNGIFFSKAVNCWAKNIIIKNADSGVILDGAKNITLAEMILDGSRRYHHGFYTKNTHDCLITNFEIRSPVIHGINSDRFGSGNVWSRGVMRHGTFDMHRGMQFDIIRTQIEINNDGSVGGDPDAGPMQGKRAVHWNIKLKGSDKMVNEKKLMKNGIIVGIFKNGKSSNFKPEIENLYEAQKKIRLNE